MPSETEISVFAIGSQVLIDGRISAQVLTIEISEKNVVSYECVWWDDLSRHVEWVQSWEVVPDGQKARQFRVNPVL